MRDLFHVKLSRPGVGYCNAAAVTAVLRHAPPRRWVLTTSPAPLATIPGKCADPGAGGRIGFGEQRRSVLHSVAVVNSVCPDGLNAHPPHCPPKTLALSAACKDQRRVRVAGQSRRSDKISATLEPELARDRP